MNTKPSRKTTSAPAPVEQVRTGLSAPSIAQDCRDNLYYLLGRFPQVASRQDHYLALAYTVRDRLLQRWIQTAETYLARQSRTVSYLSAEYLLGPQLGNNLVNLGLEEPVREAMTSLGLNLDDLIEQEEEPGLGNGGLGRLAACFLDSLATLQIPSIGYGIRYEFGIFRQAIVDGWQVERTDKWLRLGNPWEIARPEIYFDVPLGGHTEGYHDHAGNYRVSWVPDRLVRGVAYDTPVLGYRVNTVNLLRLWKAEATEAFNLSAFNQGNYYGAVLDKIVSENITKVLYPNDDSPQGKELRLQQQYFFASCSLQDMLRLFRQKDGDVRGFHLKYAIQLNDTHPSVAVAELMRLLVDVHQLSWEEAWEITRHTFAYTNHTLLPEALEKWSISLFGRLLPRLLEIIYEINQRFLDEVRLKHPQDPDLPARVSLIDEHGERYVRMAHLACVGSHQINGVAALHSDLLKNGLLRDFHQLWPEKFGNKTNGVTQRRFLRLSNPRLSKLITSRLGDAWVKDLDLLQGLEPLANDPSFRAEWRQVKLANKQSLATWIENRTGITVRPDSLFDLQAKRLHEYKRQHLNILHVIARYNRLRRHPEGAVPRTVLFAAKAAPGYQMAKRIIKLINCVADVINQDPQTHSLLKVAFLPDFNVKNAQVIYPAADLSEQISTAGMEASGTGNMKFALNGALTIGTLDGANVEIRDRVGAENFFLFGLNTQQVHDLKASGYRPADYYESNAELKEALDQIRSGHFSPHQPDLFTGLVDSLLQRDPYLVLADFAAYSACQDQVDAAYRDPEHWDRLSILNTARMGYFSSDRTIKEYCRDIWNVQPEPVELP
ncbi:MAG: glycogen/starch/alpha-glucan phosphorylase [Verrucomicrobia bacterium]|nr:glycogen/starch/alpha-glucan phosphorylase [Verrucomicrobiota bacterium]